MTDHACQPLLDWLHAPAQVPLHRFALLDSAPVEGAFRQRPLQGVRHASLFEGRREAILPEIAPLLIDLDTAHNSALQRLCEWLWSMGLEHPCLSWMASPLPLDALAAHLRLFHTVDLSEGQTMLLRWYDTRILPQWLACLTPQQHAQFCAPLANLSCLDRTACVQTFIQGRQADRMEPLSEPALGRSLVQLDDHQFAQLMHASQVDTLINRLQLLIAPELARVARARLAAFIQTHVDQLCAAGIDDTERQIQCLLPALYTSGAAWRHPAFASLLQDPPVGFKAFAAAIQGLPDDIYAADLPLWEKEDPAGRQHVAA
ncbi:DUF4123 domain-containing protein [Herbaspirillum sp. DW155]|uniref:DUF4123 domain-containing protein n=1 Tax=Herbaspirillum sp. DW155 TaxID=3095609 RepID=UPI0030912CEB|nr:DUF4123 domain-containing protein [Herbaspirillum sp. DW155]